MAKRCAAQMNVETLATKRLAKVGRKHSLAALEEKLSRAFLNRRERRALERLTKPKGSVKA